MNSRYRKFSFALMVLGIAVSGIAVGATVTGSIPIPQGETLVVDVPSGETYTYSDVISGGGGVRKTGDGKLILSGDNTFEGGFEIAAGVVEAQSATAFGEGKVTATTTVSTTYLILNCPDGVFKNDIALNGGGALANPALKCDASCTLEGDITFSRESYIGSNASGLTIVFNGTVGASGKGFLSVTKFATTSIYYNGPIRAGHFYNGHSYNCKGTDHLKSSESAITYITAVHCNLICEAENVFGGAYLSLNDDSYTPTAHFNLNGKNQKAKYLTSTSGAHTQTADSADACIESDSDKPATLTLDGSGSRTSYWAINGAVSLVLDSATLTQTFANRTNKTTGGITVKNGTLAMSGTSSFQDASSIVIDEGATFLDNSTVALSLGNVPMVTVNGVFTIGGSTSNPFANGVVTLNLGENAVFTLPEDMELKVAKLIVNGVEKSSSTGVPQIVGGSVVVMKGESSDVWVGGGATDSIALAANWKSGEAPDRTGGLTATFVDSAAVSTEADVDTPISFAAINLASDNGFTFTGAERMTVLDGGLSVAAPTYGFSPVYSFLAPFTIDKDGVIDLPAETTFRLAQTSFVGNRLAKLGEGPLLLDGTNSFAGTVIVSNGNTLVTGKVTTPNGLDETVLHPGSSYIDKENAIYFHLNEGGLATQYSIVCISNAVIEKPVWFRKRNDSHAQSFYFAAGTTNSFKAYFVSADAVLQQICTLPGSLTYLEGGAYFPWTIYQSESGTLWIRNKPVVQAGGTTGFVIETLGTVVFDVAGNSLPHLGIEADGGTYDFRVDNAINAGSALSLTGSTSSLHTGSKLLLNGTVQSFGSINAEVEYFNDQSYISGDEGSALFISNNTASSASRIAIPFKGAASLRVSTPGSVTVTNVTCTSTGSVRVDRGTLLFAKGASWTNANEVVVGGDGRLVLNTGIRNAFGRKCATMRLADDGVVAVTDGTDVGVRALYVGDRQLLPGRYSYATISDENVRRHFDPSATGTVVVGGGGLILMVR